MNNMYPNGFLFTNQKLEGIPSHFSEEKIFDYYYYHDEESKFCIEKNATSFILVHGEFNHIGVSQNLSNTEVSIKLLDNYVSNYDDFLDCLDYISGRYVVIVGNKEKIELYPDATNSRSTYFLENSIAVSSHAYLLAEVFKLGHSNVLTNFHNTLYDTPVKGVKSLVPNFVVKLPESSYRRFFPRENNKFVDVNEENKFELMEKFWKDQLDLFFNQSNNNFLTITGGGDSRMSLALSREHLDNLVLVTYAHKDSEVVDARNITNEVLSKDNIIVKQIVENLKLNHKFLYFDDHDTKLSDTDKSIVKKNTIAIHSPFLIPLVKENFSLKNLTHIRANLLEIGQAYYFRNYKESTLENMKSRFLYNNKRFFDNEEIRNKAIGMFDRFIEDLNYDKGTYNYHLLDLMYWEIQLGRWHCEILNTHDYVMNTISPFNHRALIDITLSFDYEKRKNRYFQYELINRNYPVLNFFGMNELENLYEQTIKKDLIKG